MNEQGRMLRIAAACRTFSLPWQYQWLVIQSGQDRWFSSGCAATEAAPPRRHLLLVRHPQTTVGWLAFFTRSVGCTALVHKPCRRSS